MDRRMVLLLEDSTHIIRIVEDLLQMEGFTVKVAKSVAEARTLEKKYGPFWAYLCDGSVMGNERGETFAQEMIDNDRSLVIVISANPVKGLAPKAVFLPKPFRLEELLKAVS